MKRGTPVSVTFTGTVVRRPERFDEDETEGEISVSIKVDGFKDWWAVVPAGVVKETEG